MENSLARAIANFLHAVGNAAEKIGPARAYQLSGAAYHLAEVSGCRPDVVAILKGEDSESE